MKTNLEESVVYRLLHRLEEKEYIKVKNKGEYKKIIIKFDIEEKEEWLKVYNKLNDYKHFTFSDILVYCYFLNLAKAKKSNIIDFKSSAIAQKIGVSNSTITNSINNLVNLGLFKKDKKSIIILKNLSGLQEEEKEWIDNIERIKKKSKIINTDFENMFNEFEEGYEDETGYEDEVEINLEDSFNFSISREKYSERYRIG